MDSLRPCGLEAASTCMPDLPPSTLAVRRVARRAQERGWRPRAPPPLGVVRVRATVGLGLGLGLGLGPNPNPNLTLFRLVRESERGRVQRQEAVSMVPPLLLDVQRGDQVRVVCAKP